MRGLFFKTVNGLSYLKIHTTSKLRATQLEKKKLLSKKNFSLSYKNLQGKVQSCAYPELFC